MPGQTPYQDLFSSAFIDLLILVQIALATGGRQNKFLSHLSFIQALCVSMNTFLHGARQVFSANPHPCVHN